MSTPQITITVTPGGDVQLQSNVPDQILIYGILERAKDAIRESFASRANGKQIVAAPADVLNRLSPSN